MKEFYFDNFLFKLGNNAQENDLLLNDAKQNDIWFHLDNNPSPHGILFIENEEPSKSILTLCANEIKNNSKLKNNKNVYVIYTNRKFVKKTNTLGMVIISKKNKIKV